MRVATAGFALLLVLAGCSGLEGAVPVATDTETVESATPTSNLTTAAPATDAPTATSTVTDLPTPTPTESPTPTATPTPTPDGAAELSDDNPWDQRIVHVAVNDTVRDGRNTTAIVEEALAYWNANLETYTDYALRFRLTDDVDEARIEVRFVDRIEDCDGPVNHTAGCAPLIEPGNSARDLEVARVVSDRSNAAVIGTTKHELGHLLGLDHDADPRFLMAQRSPTPVRDASDRPNPWYADTVRVVVDHDSIEADRATVDDQVGHAVDFYDAGADGTIPANVSVGRINQPHTAEILVTNSPDHCTVDQGSQIGMEGQNTDGDEAFEAHLRATICVDVDGEAVGWHVGYWLGTAFGLDEDERAAVFQDADYDDRRSEWWE